MNTIGEISNSIVMEQIISLEEKKMFEKNLAIFKKCKGFHGDFLQESVPFEMMATHVESRIKSFLAQIEADYPILLHDAYDIEEITWMCDKLRYSDRYGKDNHLYLQYSSKKEFLKSMKYFDWTYIAKTEKVVFVFDEEEKKRCYPSKATLCEPKPLDISEINELIYTRPYCNSGSDFFNMIFDSHPSLLTVGWHGLSASPIVWKVFCDGVKVIDAVNHMKNPVDNNEKDLLNRQFSHALKYKYQERIEPFFNNLMHYLNKDACYSLSDWFKAFYLSCNESVGKRFNQRIAPAIFYDKHGVGQDTLISFFGIRNEEYQEMEHSLLNFKYKKSIGVVRHPLGHIGSRYTDHWKRSNNKYNPYRSPFVTLKQYLGGWVYGRYLKADSLEYKISRQVRFEDLKLYPKETTEKVCEFLRLLWSESCLHLTTNGEDSGEVDGTVGFDIKPVYKRHLECLSALDYYRIELMNFKNYDLWGYKFRYYDGMKYSKVDLNKLLSIPFKIETLKYEKNSNWPNEQESREFHEWLLERGGDILEHGDNDPKAIRGKQNLKLVECLFPDLKPGQQLFER